MRVEEQERAKIQREKELRDKFVCRATRDEQRGVGQPSVRVMRRVQELRSFASLHANGCAFFGQRRQMSAS